MKENTHKNPPCSITSPSHNHLYIISSMDCTVLMYCNVNVNEHECRKVTLRIILLIILYYYYYCLYATLFQQTSFLSQIIVLIEFMQCKLPLTLHFSRSLQRPTPVTAYFPSDLILLFVFPRQCVSFLRPHGPDKRLILICYVCQPSSTHETRIQCWVNAGPTSATLGQH